MTKKPFLGWAILGLLAAAGSLWLVRPSAKAERKPADSLHERKLEVLSRGEPGKIDDRVRHIGNMIQEAPNDPVLHGALAAAHFERAHLADDPRNLIWALESALEAIELDPELNEALFFKARALAELSLRHEGLAAWDEYLAIETDSEKRRQASVYKLELFARGSRSPLDIENDLVSLIGADGDVENFARQELSVAQSFAIERLPKYLGEAMIVGRGEEKERWLRALKAIGKMAAEMGGDPFLSEVAESLAKAEHGPELGRALVDFARGVERHGAREFGEARPFLANAQKNFEAQRVQLEHWARFLLLGGSYSEPPSDFEKRIRALVADAEKRSYHAIRGYADWLLGYYLIETSRVEEGQSRYRGALAAFERCRWSEAAGFLRLLLSETAAIEGSTLGAWRNLHAAMVSASGIRQQGRHQAIWRTAAEFAAELSARRTALLFADVAVNAGWRSGNAISIVEAIQSRAVLREQVAEVEPMGDLTTLDRLLPALPAGSLRTKALLHLARARASGGTSLAGRLAELEQSETLYRRTGTATYLPEILLAKARVYIEDRQPQKAEAALEEAARLLESQKTGQPSIEQRAHLLDVAREVYEEWIRLRLGLSGAPQAILEIVEKFLQFKRPGFGVGTPRPDFLPSNVAVITIFSLPERLLIWVSTQDDVQLVDQVLRREVLQAALRELLDSLAGSDYNSFREASEQIWRILIDPTQAGFDGRWRLVFELDSFLGSVPVAALVNHQGEFLIEKHTVEVSPIWPLVAASKSRPRERALVIGNPSFDEEEFPQFDELKGSLAEARRIDKIYSNAKLLLGPQPTPEVVTQELAALPDVLHVASHLTWRNQAAELPQLLLAKSDRGSVLAAEDIQLLPFKAPDLVYLAACNSSLRGGRSGNRIPSMAEVFLGRGALAVIGSAINLNDRQSVRMATAFHERYKEGGRPEAVLRDLQREMSKDSQQRVPWWCALLTHSAAVSKEKVDDGRPSGQI